MTKAEMLRRMGGYELSRWRRFEDAYGPLGPERASEDAAAVAKVIADVNRDPKSEPYDLDDFRLREPSYPLPEPDDEGVGDDDGDEEEPAGD